MAGKSVVHKSNNSKRKKSEKGKNRALKTALSPVCPHPSSYLAALFPYLPSLWSLCYARCQFGVWSPRGVIRPRVTPTGRLLINGGGMISSQAASELDGGSNGIKLNTARLRELIWILSLHHLMAFSGKERWDTLDAPSEPKTL
ncbi:hypothetical protein AOLI_G00281980 [Acnodon oligacanthus]